MRPIMSEGKETSPRTKPRRGVRLAIYAVLAVLVIGLAAYIVSIINETSGIYGNEDQRFKPRHSDGRPLE
jgi:hypothetical protein